MESNPGSVVEYEANGRYYHLCFVSLSPFINTFRHCRPVLTIETCHLKGPYQGLLFAANTLDGNKRLVSVSFGIFDQENAVNWEWFLNHLRHTINPLPPGLVVISDRQKGLIDAFGRTFNGIPHGHCVFHLVSNVNSKFKSHKYVVSSIWEAAKTFSNAKFDAIMVQIRSVDEAVYQYLMESEPSSWANCKFPGKR